MAAKTDRSLSILRTIQQLAGGQQSAGSFRLHIVTVQTTNPLTFILEGVDAALDEEIFTIPEDFKPLEEGATYFALPMAGDEDAPHWGLLQRVTKGAAANG